MKQISIIVPFYRGLNQLDDCLESVREQELEKDSYEVLCMGDAPEEGIVSVINKYESDGMPIRYVQWFENKGVCYARNRGLELAEGEYIYFLDSDDYMMPGCLKRLLECAVKYDARIVRGDIIGTFENKQAFNRKKHCRKIIKSDRKGNDAWLSTFFSEEVTVLNMLIKKSFIDEADVLFPDGIRYFGDMEFVMKLLVASGEYYLANSAILAKRVALGSGASQPINNMCFNGVNAEKMMRDLISVYKNSNSLEGLSPKKRNIISYILCKNTLRMLSGETTVSDETLRCLSVYVKEAVKILPNRFETVEKLVLYLAGRRYYAVAGSILKICRHRKKKNRIRGFVKDLVVALYNIMYILLPVRKRVVVLSSALGRSYAGNPKAIYEEMVKQGLDKEYNCVWFYDSSPHNIPGKHKQVKFQGLKYLYYMAIAGFCIFDARQPKFLRKSNRTVYLQTWHGTPLKKLGIDLDKVFMSGETDIEEYREEFRRNAGIWDMLISQNGFSSETFRRAFDYKGEMLETGYPRNDGLFTYNTQESVNNIKTKLGLPADKKIMLYAPTWRDDDSNGLGRYNFSCGLDIDLMKQNFGKEYVLAIKYHYLVDDNIDWSIYGGFVHIFDQSEDITDIYLASDILITDYSSVMFDYSILKRPMYFYCYDLLKYKNTLRGFYFDFEKTAPGPISLTTEQLVEDINRGITEENERKYDAFVAKYNPWDDGHASENVVRHLFEKAYERRK